MSLYRTTSLAESLSGDVLKIPNNSGVSFFMTANKSVNPVTHDVAILLFVETALSVQCKEYFMTMNLGYIGVVLSFTYQKTQQ